MKKILGIVLSLATVMTLCSFVIAHNVNKDKTDNPESITANDGWEYYKPVTVYTNNGTRSYEHYIWKKTVCGDPDYLISWSRSALTAPKSISKNYNYGKDQDWTSEYKYTAGLSGGSTGDKCYFNAYLQGWDK